MDIRGTRATLGPPRGVVSGGPGAPQDPQGGSWGAPGPPETTFPV